MIVAGVWTGVGFSNLKNSPTRIRTRILKYWNRSGVGVWKSDSRHLCCNRFLNRFDKNESSSGNVDRGHHITNICCLTAQPVIQKVKIKLCHFLNCPQVWHLQLRFWQQKTTTSNHNGMQSRHPSVSTVIIRLPLTRWLFRVRVRRISTRWRHIVHGYSTGKQPTNIGVQNRI